MEMVLLSSARTKRKISFETIIRFFSIETRFFSIGLLNGDQLNGEHLSGIKFLDVQYRLAPIFAPYSL